MPYVLGIDIGSTCTTAAVSRYRDAGWTRPEIVRLGRQSPAVPSALHVAANGSLTVGDPGQHGAEMDAGRVARGFSRRIGDDVPMVVAGETCSPQTLTAVLAMWVVERVLEQEGAHAEQIVLSHPACWGPYRKELLHQALWEIGLANVRLLPEPVTAAESHALRGVGGGTLAVYAMGGNGFEASVVRRARRAGFELLACRAGVEPLGGADFDEALVAHVRAKLRRELDPADPQLRSALSGLRRECARAKEELTVAEQAEVLVPLSPGPARVPVSRAEFERMIRPALQVTVDTLLRTVHAAGLRPAQVDAVLLVGGSSRVPLVAELVGARFPGPVAVEPDPQVTAAAGAALAAGQIVALAAAAQHDPARWPQDPGGRPHDPAGGPHDPARWPEDPGGRPQHAGIRQPADDLSMLPARQQDHRADENAPPPRPPVTITPLKLPKKRSASRLVPGRTGARW